MKINVWLLSVSYTHLFTVSGKGEVKISSLFYKEGESSLEWDFQPGSTLDVQIAPLSLNTRNEKQFGITSVSYTHLKDLFQFGLLDQGWWPDGLYTAPSDEALAFPGGRWRLTSAAGTPRTGSKKPATGISDKVVPNVPKKSITI